MECTTEGISKEAFETILYAKYRLGKAQTDLWKCKSHAPEDDGVDELAVAELVSLGFEEPQVRTALELAAGDKQAAANICSKFGRFYTG